MDPNETLEQIRERVEAAGNADAAGLDLTNDHMELVELIQGLDEWLSNGGFPPSAWSQGGRVTDAQGRAFADLLRRFHTAAGAQVQVGSSAFGLPDTYLCVELRPDGFTCGIDPEGSVSS